MTFNLFRRKPKDLVVGSNAPLATSAVAPQGADQAGKSVQPEHEKRTLPVLASKVHRTEKATALGMLNQYVFQLDRRANKQEFRKAVERHYDVHVEKVRMINTTGKKRRVKGMPGWKPGHKKAIVSVRTGEKIDIGV